ncbi:MAG: sigma-70 family RNA polymerase sigma factor [Egibacteraceae bacterium]
MGPNPSEADLHLPPPPGAPRARPAQAGVATDVAQLVTSAQAGCAQSFARLYDRYLGTVYAYILHRVAHRPTAEDLTADVFMRALRRIGTFRQRGVDFGAWLLTIARNRVHDHFKSASFRLEASVDEVCETPSSDGAGDPETALLSQEAVRQVQVALRQLNGEQAKVLSLRFIQHLDVSETAAAMGKSVGAIRALQYRALRSLAKLVGVPAPAKRGPS